MYIDFVCLEMREVEEWKEEEKGRKGKGGERERGGGGRGGGTERGGGGGQRETERGRGGEGGARERGGGRGGTERGGRGGQREGEGGGGGQREGEGGGGGREKQKEGEERKIQEMRYGWSKSSSIPPLVSHSLCMPLHTSRHSLDEVIVSDDGRALIGWDEVVIQVQLQPDAEVAIATCTCSFTTYADVTVIRGIDNMCTNYILCCTRVGVFRTCTSMPRASRPKRVATRKARSPTSRQLSCWNRKQHFLA